TDAYGQGDSYVVRASGTRQARNLPALRDPKNATVQKLDDGREYANTIILASLIDDETRVPSEEF
ncbi:hypothetical protein, partial [Streptomyces katsurahamanus]|uniref:hypothetical protein n=1 Tax=Streptomyces katsurahamanus TaxID=2577098 RepID=UPI0018866E7F